ncbi:MAG TPA: type II secretion system protein N [Burkholderiales bacterium]
MARASIRRIAGYVALGIALYAAFLIATAPASWLAEAVARLTDGRITFSAPSGTLWRGSAELHAGSGAAGIRHLGRLHWRINPWWLFLGRAHARVELAGTMAQGSAALRVAPGRRIAVENLSAALPADIAALVYAPAAFFEPRGTIALRAPSVVLSASGLWTDLEVQWQNAGGRFTGPASLGDYRVSVAGEGQTAAIRLDTLRGDLDLAGQGQWNVTGDGMLRFNGTATPRGDAARLEPLLRPLGRDLGDGRRQIRFTTRLPLIEQLGLS